MQSPGQVRAVSGEHTLDVDVDWLGELLIGDQSPEWILGQLVDRWRDQRRIAAGVFFVRRHGGWARLVSRGSEQLPGAELRDAVRGVASTRLWVFTFERSGETVGRLIVMPSSDRIHLPVPPLPGYLSGALTLFLGTIKERSIETLAMLTGECRARLPRVENDTDATLDAESPQASDSPAARRSAHVIDGVNGVSTKKVNGSGSDGVKGTIIHGPNVPGPNGHGIIGQSASIRRAIELAQQVAKSDVSVLVHGESGTGKELFARLIHDQSERSSGPFVGENCAAFSPTLLEAEIFGSEKGAYTGADQLRRGLLERANGGTLFLDEVAEMDLSLQRKLLRVLQERCVRRVGGAEALPVDFRLIAATHKDLDEEVAAGRFRADLLYRIVVIQVPVPPLRERRDDIPLLVRHFLRHFARDRKIPAPLVDPVALQKLSAYAWPGNVRELRNEIERAFTLSPAGIGVDSLSDRFSRQLLNPSVAQHVRREVGADIRDLERVVIGGIIRDVLRETKGNKTRAAAILGLPKTTLYRRLEHYGISGSNGVAGQVCDRGGSESSDGEDE